MIVVHLAAAAFSEILTTCLLSYLLKEDDILHYIPALCSAGDYYYPVIHASIPFGQWLPGLGA